MTIKKPVAAIAALVLLVAGYALGIVIGVPNINGDGLSGNVGKASLYNSGEQDPEILAAMEQLQSDTLMQQNAVAAAIILSSHINTIDSLTTAAIEATKDIKAFKEANKELQSLKRRTSNAKTCYDAYMEATAKVINGEKVADYEQLSNNALLAFTVLDNNMSQCAGFIDLMAEYLEENENEGLHKAFEGWMAYCAEDAMLNNDTQETEYWKNAYANVQGSSNLKAINAEALSARYLSWWGSLRNTSESLKAVTGKLGVAAIRLRMNEMLGAKRTALENSKRAGLGVASLENSKRAALERTKRTGLGTVSPTWTMGFPWYRIYAFPALGIMMRRGDLGVQHRRGDLGLR